MRLLTDADVRAFPLPAALAAVRAGVLAHARSELEAPARLHAAGLTFTAGASPEVLGFRAYHTHDLPHDDQLVAAWDAPSGRLLGAVAGEALGPLRTACLGVLAAQALARPEAAHLGLIGSGVQARMHALVLHAVRPLSRVRVYSRDPAHRERLAAELRAAGLPAEAAASAEEVARESDLLTLATDSGVPVIETAWVQPGTHVTTLGPKVRARHEFPPDLADAAALVVTDSPAQLNAYPGGHLFAGRAVASLGAVLLDGVPDRTPQTITLFLSVGLAGTEVYLARALLEQARAGEGG